MRQVTNSTVESYFSVGYVPGTGQMLYYADKGGNEIDHIYQLNEDGTSQDLTEDDRPFVDDVERRVFVVHPKDEPAGPKVMQVIVLPPERGLQGAMDEAERRTLGDLERPPDRGLDLEKCCPKSERRKSEEGHGRRFSERRQNVECAHFVRTQ